MSTFRLNCSHHQEMNSKRRNIRFQNVIGRGVLTKIISFRGTYLGNISSWFI